MGFLYFLEDIRIPILNKIMLLITALGEETAFLVIALVLYWCIDKQLGYYTLSVGFVGTIFNQFLKLCFRIPRPWILDQNFTIVEQAREAASGYSFPSGHTQSAVGTFGSIAHKSRNKKMRTICIGLACCVCFSRMYLGVHTPKDVTVSAAIGILLIFALYPLFFGKAHRYLPILLLGMLVLSIGYLVFVVLYPFPQNVDLHNLQSGTENAYTLLGSMLGLIAVYIVDKKWLNFTTEAVWWAQVMKVIMGLALVLAVKAGLKQPLNFVLGESLGRMVRYFLVVITAGALWPLSFPWFSKLGYKE